MASKAEEGFTHVAVLQERREHHTELSPCSSSSTLYSIDASQSSSTAKFSAKAAPILNRDPQTVQEELEKKRQIRLMKNRQSAALSRQRKKDYINNLQKQYHQASQANSNIQSQITRITNDNWELKVHCEKMEKEITKLLKENNELKGKLRSVGYQIDDTPRTIQDLGIKTPSQSHNQLDLIAATAVTALSSIVEEELRNSSDNE